MTVTPSEWQGPIEPFRTLSRDTNESCPSGATLRPGRKIPIAYHPSAAQCLTIVLDVSGCRKVAFGSTTPHNALLSPISEYGKNKVPWRPNAKSRSLITAPPLPRPVAVRTNPAWFAVAQECTFC